MSRVGLACRFEANCPLGGPGHIGDVPSVGVFLRDPTRVSEKTTEYSERLGRQARPKFEPATSRLPVWSATTSPLVGRGE